MNCAEKYDYIAEELLVCHIYTLGGQVIYNNLLLAGWRDFQEITKPLNVTEITKLVAKKKRREDAIFDNTVGDTTSRMTATATQQLSELIIDAILGTREKYHVMRSGA